MSDKKNSFVFYETFYEVIKELDDDVKLKFYTALSEYGLFGKRPNFTGIEKALWVQFQYSIDKAKERYNASVENGKKGGRPRKDNLEKPNNNLEKPNNNLNVNVNDNVNVYDNVYGDVRASRDTTTALDSLGCSFGEKALASITESLRERELGEDYIKFVSLLLNRKRFKKREFGGLPQDEKNAIFFKALTEWRDIELLYKDKGFEALDDYEDFSLVDSDKLESGFAIDF